MTESNFNQNHTSQAAGQNGNAPSNQIERWMILLVIAAGTAITASPLAQSSPQLLIVLKLIAYLATIGFVGFLLWPTLRRPHWSLRQFFASYRKTILFPLLLYFTGLLIGALSGPATLASLQQTASDGLVMVFAFAAFGWLCRDLDRAVRDTLRVVALLSLVILVPSFIIYVGNLQGWWLINPFYFTENELFMNGPFNHANHLGYVMMTGMLAAAVLATTQGALRENKIWIAIAFLLGLGLFLTQARGAFLGGGIGMVVIAANFWRSWAKWILGISTILVVLGLGFQVLWDPGQAHLVLGVVRAPLESLLESDPPVSNRQSGPVISLGPYDRAEGSIHLQPDRYRMIISGTYLTPNRQNDPVVVAMDQLRFTFQEEMGDERELLIPIANIPSYNISSPFEISEAGPVRILLEPYPSEGSVENARGTIFLRAFFFVPEGILVDSFELYDRLPKAGISARRQIWAAALANLQAYGPLGIGDGQTESWPGLSTHSLVLEQYGEGGVLTTIGFLAWFVLPLLFIRESRLSSKLSWGVVAMMAALLVHGVFWTQFLNGLRYLTLVYVSLWTALATLRIKNLDERR